MRKTFSLIITVLVLFSCGNTKEENKYSDSEKFYGIADPVRLSPGNDKIDVTGFYKNPAKIDSFTFHQAIDHQFQEESNQLELTIDDENLPSLTEMKIWSGGKYHSVLLIKSRKISYTFTFVPQKEEYKKVQLAGNFNGWSPDDTELKKKDGKWQTQLFLNPGKYQYQIVADGEWMLDPTNPKKTDNNQGGYNSVFTIEKGKQNAKPHLITDKTTKNKIKIRKSGNVDKVFALWQNNRLDPKIKDNKLTIDIPDEATKSKRSYIRVYACNDYGRSNDVFIPLQNGEVVESTEKITRSDKRSTIMYFTLVDRFNNGNPKNDDPLENPKVHDKANYHGGDLDGIREKIEDGYISDLGFNSIWISPITQNPEKAYREYPAPHRLYSGYHGYWPVTLTTVDHRFGDSEALHNLVNTAHNNNMNIILDFVSNHVHEKNPLYKKHPEWATDMILPSGDTNIRIWDEQRLTTWFDTFLPTLDLRKPEVVETMSDSALYWIKEYNLDGFRHDATKHIPLNYWETLTHKLRKQTPTDKDPLQIGETFGSRELIGDYVGNGKLDGQFDFNLYFDARSVFAKDEASFKTIEQSVKESFSYYGWHSLMGNITGNHDIPRFISYASGALDFDEDGKAAGWERDIQVEDPDGYKKLSSLTAFIMTIPGVPVVYYGDEIGMPGAGDPDNRRDMRFDDLSKHEQETKETAKKLINLRKENMELLYGDFKFLKTTDKTFVYARKYFDNASVIFFNKSEEPKEVSIKLPEYLNGFTFKEHFNSKWTMNEGELNIMLEPYSFEVLNN